MEALTSAVSDYSLAFGRISTIRSMPDLADKVATLSNFITNEPDASLARQRAELLRDGRDPIGMHNLVRAAEIDVFAKAVAACFEGTPHFPYARSAAFQASFFSTQVHGDFIHRIQHPSVSGHCAGDEGYRASLLKRLYWVHQYGTVRDTMDDGEHTCLSLFTTYLQFILRSTPMSHWAPAAAADPSNPSPLSLALGWARASPAISAHTVDVVVLVTMGRHIYKIFVDRAIDAKRLPRAPGFGSTLCSKGVAAILDLFWQRKGLPQLTSRAQQSQTQHLLSVDENLYTPIDESDTAEAMQPAADMLLRVGEEYAQLLTEPDIPAADVQVMLERLRTCTATMVAKAHPLISSNILMAIPGLHSKQEDRG